MKTELIDIEVQLLLAKYGADAVVRAVAVANNATPDGIAQAIERYRVQSTQRREKKATQARGASTVEKILGDRPDLQGSADRYRDKQFLPTLRETHSFLEAHGIKSRAKSRAAALPVVLKVLAKMPTEEVSRSEKGSRPSSDTTAFSQLANELMRSRDRGKEEES